MSRCGVSAALYKRANEDPEFSEAYTRVASLLLTDHYLDAIPVFVYYDLDTSASDEIMSYLQLTQPLVYNQIWLNPDQLCCFRLIASQRALLKTKCRRE